MQRLQTAPNLALATLWADWLRQAGFGASVQRGNAVALAGGIPPDQALPEVWIEDDDADTLAAAQTQLELLAAGTHRRWCCRGCGEQIEGPFEQCWNCGTAMPA